MSKYQVNVFVVLFFVAYSLVFSPAWMSLIERWNKMDESYSHGYLVLVLCIYYVVQQVRSIDFQTVKPNYIVVPVLMLCSLLWSLSYYAHIEVIQQLLLPVMIMLFFILTLGTHASQSFVFPVFLLFFAIPFWDYLTETLQNMTVYVNGLLLGLVGIPAYIEGVFVTIPFGTFEVAGGCSGLRYLIVASTLAVLYAYQHYSKWSSRIVLLLTAIFFAFFANWMRVFIIIVVGHVTQMRSDLIHHHDFFGWGLFAVTLIPFFYLAGRYRVWFKDDEPQIKIIVNHWPATFKFTPFLIAFLATFTLPLLISSVEGDYESPQADPVFIGVAETKLKQWVQPVFSGADTVVDRSFIINKQSVQLAFRRYVQQYPGKELIFYSNYIYSSEWEAVLQENQVGFSFVELSMPDKEQNILVASQYSISGVKVANSAYAKLIELLKPLMSSQISNVLILAAACEITCDSARDRINLFISDNAKVINAL